MVSTAVSSYSSAQVTAWLRGLLTVAWADGDFTAEEQALIDELTREELAPCLAVPEFTTIEAAELAVELGPERSVRENFLRMAVMVAVADGTYSPPEHELLMGFCGALELDGAVLDGLQVCLVPLDGGTVEEGVAGGATGPLRPPLDLSLPDAIANAKVLEPVRHWLDGLEVQDPRLARFLCKSIPSQCPFERDVELFGRKVVHIPPLCKLNPLYDQLVGLRFRALSYLADDCGEDVSPYI